jgi:hypothetical protein
MTNPNQKRLSDILIQQGSTATQFMHALTYYTEYPNNKLWAEASVDNKNTPINEATEYYNQRLALIAKVRKDWNNNAGLIIGTTHFEQKEHMTAVGKLVYHPTPTSGSVSTGAGVGGTSAATTDAQGCPTSAAPGGAVGGKFTDMVKAYAWPTYHSAPYVNPYNEKMKPEYLAAVKAATKRGDYVGGGQYPGVDCGGFLTLLFHDSGADPNYNKYRGNVVSQRRYLNEASTGPGAKYQKMTNITSAGQLRMGDVYINSDASHTYVFMGSGVFVGNNAASASFSTTGADWRTPMASKAYDFASATWYRPLYPLN